MDLEFNQETRAQVNLYQPHGQTCTPSTKLIAAICNGDNDTSVVITQIVLDYGKVGHLSVTIYIP